MPFDPTSVAGLRVWLDASQLTGLSDGDPVASWPNLVTAESESFTQGTTTARPTYRAGILNGLAGILFDGTADHLDGSVGRLQKPVTVFVVVQWGGANDRYMVGNATAINSRLISTVKSGKFVIGLRGVTDIGASATDFPVDTAVLWDYSYGSSGAWLIGMNGADDAAGTNDRVVGSSPITVGARDSNGNFWADYIHEILVYDSVLGTTDRQDVRGYLVAKWLTAPPSTGGGEAAVSVSVAATGGGGGVGTMSGGGEAAVSVSVAATGGGGGVGTMSGGGEAAVSVSVAATGGGVAIRPGGGTAATSIDVAATGGGAELGGTLPGGGEAAVSVSVAATGGAVAIRLGGGTAATSIAVAATGGGILVDTPLAPPRMRTWRVEAWTHPRKGTPKFITEVPYRTLHMADRRDAIVDSDITIPEGADVLDLIAVADPTDPSAGVSTLLRCFPVDTDPDFVDPLLPDFEFFAARRDSEIGEDAQSYAKISGPDIRAGANDAQLLPWDYPGTEIDGGRRTRFPDWQWGGNNIADNGDLEGGVTNTTQQVWITDAAPGVTALNGAVDGAVGTVVVDTAVGFPSSDGFTILIDSERMRVTGGAGTTTWTVTRGVDGTTPAAHSDGATVDEVAAGTFTITFDGESTTALPWNPEGGGTTVDAAGLKTALETLPNIIAVDVNGAGTPSDPFTIEFVDPAGAVPALGGSDTITGGDLAAGLITQQGGIPTASPWTRSYNPGTGLTHGVYASNGVTGEDVFDYGAITGNGSLWVYGSRLLAGAQQIVTVPPGALVQFSVNHRTTETGQTYAFVVRDLNEQLVHPNAVARYTPAPDTVTAMELVDVVIPDNVDQVIVRVAVVGPEGLTRSWWQIDDLVVRVGYPPATKGAIALTVLDDLQTAHAPRTRLGWLTPGFTATHDAAGVPWTSEIEFAARWRDRFGTDFADRLFRETGGDWDIEPVLVGGEPVGWELRAWEVGSRGVDRTADIDPAFIIGAGIQGGSVSHAEPPFTALTVANDDGIFVELEDTDLVAAYGHIDGAVADGAFRNTAAMTEVAAAALHNVLVNQVSAQTRIGPGGPIPWAEFKPGDTVTFALAGRVGSAHGRVVSQITVDVSPTGWTAEVTASRLFTGLAAAEEGIRLLLERVENLERAADTTGSVAVLQPPGLRIPGLVAGADAAPEWKAAASFVCDGSNDSAVLQAVADAAWFGNGPEELLVVGSFVLTDALALRGGVALVGVGANIDGGSGAYFEREGGPVITLNNGGNRILNLAVVGIGSNAPAVSAISLADLVITGCYLWADDGPTLRLDGVSMAWVTRCRILQGGTSPTVYWSHAKASHLTECVMEYGGILIDGDINDMTVSGNLVSFSEGDGIRVSDGAVRVRVAHNVVEDAQEHGIVIDDTTAQVDNVWVHNNAVVGAGYGSDNAFDGILIAGSPTRVDVRDNRVAAQAGATRMRWGINPSDTCTEVHIVGNDLTLEGAATFGSGAIRTGSAGDFDLALPADPTYGANWT